MRARQRVPDREECGGSLPSEPTAKLSTNFRQNLSFFQKAAQNLTRSSPQARARPPARRSSVGSDGSSSTTSAPDAADEEDFEPVLFVNGRPRYMTSEPSGALIGGAATAAESDSASARPDSSAEARAEWSGAQVGGGQKVRIGGTAAERIRAGSRSASGERLTNSKTPARSGREVEPTAGTSRSSSVDSGLKNFREKTPPNSKEKTSSSSRDKVPVGSSKRDKSYSSSSSTSSKRDAASSSGNTTSVRDGSSSSKREHSSENSRDRADPAAVGQSPEDVQPPRRKPYIRFSSVESQNHLSHDDLTYFKQTIGIVSGGGITRTQSCQEGLDAAPPRPTVSRTLSVSSLADVGAAEPRSLTGSRTSLRRAPSVEEILESVKALRARRAGQEPSGAGAAMVRSSEPEAEYQNVSDVTGSVSNGTTGSAKSKSSSTKGRPTPWSGVQFCGPVRGGDPDEGYENADDVCYENVSGGQALYQNAPAPAPTPAAEVIYDQPVKQRRKRRGKASEETQQLYENVQFSEPTSDYQNTSQPTYTNLTAAQSAGDANDTVYENVEKGPVVVSGNGVVAGTYDVPRTASHIYDAPQRTRVKHLPAAEAGEYDAPRPTYGTGGRASGQGETSNKKTARPTQIVIQGEPAMASGRGKEASDCDRDSLEEETARRPDIPSPDYGSDGDDVDGIPNDYIGDDQLDEGLGESDARSYYNEDPGLEVILEEPEDEYVTSSEEEEEPAQRRSLRSLEGSEGIGSAEGDSGSNASVESSSGVHSAGGSPTLRPPVDEKEERIQKDRCVEVYPETMRQRKQAKKSKQKADGKQPWAQDANEGPALVEDNQHSVSSSNSNSAGNSSKNSTSRNNAKPVDSPSKIKKLLPSVKALKSQFENSSAPAEMQRPRSKDKSPSPPKQPLQQVTPPIEQTKNIDGSTADVPPQPRQTSPQRSAVSGRSSNSSPKKVHIPDEPVDIIYDKFGEVDERLLKQRITTLSWDPTTLVSRLYEVPQPASRSNGEQKGYVNIEGWLEKLPSGRKKATFWNAWKRRYFKAKDGFLYYYQTNTTEKPSMVLQLMGGNVEVMDSSVIGVDDGIPQTVPMLSLDDGKGHYVVVRCSSRQEADRWTRALSSHTVEDYNATYVQPVSLPPTVTSQRRCVVIDLGSSSIRAGILHEQPTLPQLFFPAVMVTSREAKQATFGTAALRPEVRAEGTLTFPLRPSSKITKYSVDVPALAGLLQLTFRELRVTPSDYCVQLSLPRSFNTATLGEILRLLFDKFGAQGVNLTHQSILAMWSYNATSGVVVDIGDRMDVVPVIDGYIVEGGVSRVPYGGVRIQDHLRHFLLQKHFSLVTEVESLVVRYALERLCYVSERYGADMEAFNADPASIEKTLSVKEFLGDNVSWRRISLDSGRFQATEGLFTPDAWGLDNKGVHKLVHKAVQECSVDIRKEMVRSIYLAGGVTLLPGFAERLQIEMDKLTPASVTPKVHASPYRYHAAYLGACVLASSDGFQQAMVTRDSWVKLGINALKKWTV